MSKCILLLISILLSSPLYAHQIALTFDDAPRGDELIYTGPQRTQKIIKSLNEHDVQAMFFVNTDKFSKSNGADRIAAYSQAGHLIANHTHSHPRLSDTPVKIFNENIDKADEILKHFPTFKPWFRFPYLGEGPTLEIRDQVRLHLKFRGYKNGYVTVDNYDYFINDLVQKALIKGQKVDLYKACDMLVDIMWDGIKYYDDLAQKHLGSVRHVLLMHENDIEAHCLSKLITHIKAQGWKIVSPEVAFKDPILNAEPETLYLNQGRVAAMIHSKLGLKYISQWESETALKAEFERRKIISK